MSTLSNQERHALDDVFISISSNQPSYLKLKISHYHAYFVLHIKGHYRAFSEHKIFRKSKINPLKNPFLQKNSQKS